MAETHSREGESVTVKLLQADPGTLRLDRIIDKGLFIGSLKSRALQLADLCTYMLVRARRESLASRAVRWMIGESSIWKVRLPRRKTNDRRPPVALPAI